MNSTNNVNNVVSFVIDSRSQNTRFRGSFVNNSSGYSAQPKIGQESSSNTDRLVCFVLLSSIISTVFAILYFLRRAVLSFVFFTVISTHANDFSRLADIIKKVEGNKFYGIKSVKVHSETQARRVCITTLSNNYVRWQQSGKNSHFLIFLANRYCPKSSDPVGHKNWVRNITILTKRAGLEFK